MNSGDSTVLLDAAFSGDWKAAETLIARNPVLIDAPLNCHGDTALHIATAAKQKRFVKKLVDRMRPSALTLRNFSNLTAFSFAVLSGVVEMAEVMLNRNQDLLYIGSGVITPLHLAASNGQIDMVRYLYRQTNFENFHNPEVKTNIFHYILAHNIYDVALEMLESYPSLASAREKEATALHWMATKASAMEGENMFSHCIRKAFRMTPSQHLAHRLVQRLFNIVVECSTDTEQLWDIILRPPMLQEAATCGNHWFVVILLRSYPDLMWSVEMQIDLFEAALASRQMNIFNLIYELDTIKQIIVCNRDAASNEIMLHRAANLPAPNVLEKVSGAALQMQNELLWFEAVKELTPYPARTIRNSSDEAPEEKFRRTHKGLKEAGEKWLMMTAQSCMLVATLVATVVFAVAFTVPGGNDQLTGIPLFQKERFFAVFVVSDAVALFSSSTSVLSFLSILTSRYTEADFKIKLPLKLASGLLTLFLAIAAMIVTFTVSLLLIYESKFAWMSALNVSLACITIFWFLLFHLRLPFDTLRSLFSNVFLFPRSQRLFSRSKFRYLPFRLEQIVGLR